MNLNTRAMALADSLVVNEAGNVMPIHLANEGRIIDCGVNASGGLETGRRLAEICLSGLGTVSLLPSTQPSSGIKVSVATDQPVAACMASQYAGWQVSKDGYFAMGSGPMRAASGREELFAEIGLTESGEFAVGVLESRDMPTDSVVEMIAEACGVATKNVTLLVAPTASLAGAIQVVARSVETALHKLHELGFDLSRVASGFGVAALPFIPKDDLAGIGVTNDAVLYGGEVTLWVRGDDASLENIGPRVPSSASHDYGKPFIELFEQYDRDFYKIDPMLFSPALVRFNNLDTGSTYSFGSCNLELLAKSFG